MTAATFAHLLCINPACGARFPATRTVFACEACGDLLDVAYDWDAAHADLGFTRNPEVFATRHCSGAAYAADPAVSRGAGAGPGAGPGAGAGAGAGAALNASGVWRFRELLPYWSRLEDLITLGEGRTILQRADALAAQTGFAAGELFLQYEGFNPSGSFKDNGMAAAFTHARAVSASRVLCASTGNTSASLAMYAANHGFRALVLIGSGKIAFGKLSQALDFGARTLQVTGDFDACLRRVEELGIHHPELGIYVMNSINPFRLEGQKTIMFRVLEALGWSSGGGGGVVPDWIVVPGGNLGNTSAFGKAFMELKALGMLPSGKVPRLAVINAAGARTLDRLYNEHGLRWNEGRYDHTVIAREYERMNRAGERARTIASAIEIGRPVNLPKALRSLEFMNGVVRAIDDETILENKALIGRHGYGCEPACAASLAGARLLRREGIIKPGERIVCIITGHGLKDPDATVKYHTGVDMKAAHEGTPRQPQDPRGALANQPIPVGDSAQDIIAAMQG